jgi:hypothetical protein
MPIGGSDHVLRRPLTEAIQGKSDPKDVIEAVLHCLADYRLINYRGDAVPLLTAVGRLMVDLTRNPDSTLREASVRLGTTESNVGAQMTNLVNSGLIERTRVGMRNHYKMNVEAVLLHPDSAALIDALLFAAGYSADDSGDITPNLDT